MNKPKLSIAQTCYFAMFGRNPETNQSTFTVHSGKVKGLEYDSETDSIDYILEVPFEITQTPKWLHRLFPRRFKLFQPIHALYHHIHKSNIYVANESEVFYDIRDAVDDASDLLNLQEDAEG